jgi:aspartokinase-like uncharacterized kinase
MIVVKVGGSLYDHPQLGPGLRAFLDTLPPPVLLVPGGGAFADAVRKLDAVHQLGEEAAHRLALTSLWAADAFLRTLVPGAVYAADPDTELRVPVRVLDAHGFCRSDDALPHSWDVTSDSIAARAAVVYGASRLVLLKSLDVPPGTPWAEAAANGWVDAHFPHVAATLACPIEVVNFRRRLEQLSRCT